MKQNLLIRQTRCINKTGRTFVRLRLVKIQLKCQSLEIIRVNNSLEGRSVEFGKSYFITGVSQLKKTELDFR